MISSILVFILVLSVLVIVHEFGHYWVAKKNGVWVEEFGFGLPPKIFGKRIGETIFSLNLFPFGGFVRLHGEMEEEGITNPNRAFLNKKKRVRALIVIAGVVMNFILAVVCFAIVYSFSGIPRDSHKVKVLDVTAGTPAQISGLISGDIIKSVDGKVMTKADEFISYVDTKKGKKVTFEVERDSNNIKLTATPRENPPQGEGPLGVIITNTEIYYPPVIQRPFYGIYYGFKDAVFWGKTVIVGFATMFGGLFRGQAPQDFAGPVGIFAITSQAAKVGALSVINFIGILSVNLAILNILPIPALDGGRLLFIAIEGVIGKKIIPKVESIIHSVGFILLILLLIAITAHDIRQVITAGGISNFLNGFLK
ncbi:MAG: M50 family metallopeptidase [Microgenomates group bacterium]